MRLPKRALLLTLGIAVMLVNIAVAAPKDSLYSVPMQWRTENSDSTAFSAFAGKPVILTLAYTHCKTACPFTMQRLIKLRSQFEQRRIPASFVVVSLDPQSDSPEELRKFKESYRLFGGEWHFLVGDEATLRKLSVLLGYSYQKKDSSGEIMHSNKIVLLDRHGAIIKNLEGLDSDTSMLADEAAGLMKEQ